MAFKRRPFIRVALGAIIVFALYSSYRGTTGLIDSVNTHYLFAKLSNKHDHPSQDTLESLFLTEEQCTSTFPALTKEIDDAVGRGSFNLEKVRDDATGLVQGRIKNGKLYIISFERQPSKEMLYERNAVLHQLHRAILTSPSSLPDTIFTFSIIDHPLPNTWSFSRSNDPSITGNYWVMPHFSFWSWPLPFIGTMDEAMAKIDRVETETPWEKKIDKAVWRGTAWFNSVGNVALRPNLLQLAEGKEWADVQNLLWETNGVNASNAIGIEDFCRYKYIIYTEGITYSGRLPFHQACASIILTPPPSYLLHTTHLMRPLFSSALRLSSSAENEAENNARWPRSFQPSQANVIFIDPDWKDLEQTISYLRAHPDIAKGIAQRQRDMIVKAGYLSPAAETCYWRALIRGWSQVVNTTDEKWGGDGMRWETFSLTAKTK